MEPQTSMGPHSTLSNLSTWGQVIPKTPKCLKLVEATLVCRARLTATELCMTKGQEAVVHFWQAGKTSDGTAILDTLFVCLINPPSQVQLDKCCAFNLD